MHLLCVMLLDKIQAVEVLFEKLDQEIATFQSSSGLHCKFGCGKCCYKADIEATTLEFLPFAYHLYKTDIALEWLEKLKTTTDSICLILNPTQNGAGLCSEYIYRGMICRLFGYSARTNKYNKAELVTCQIIKTEQANHYQQAVNKIENGGEVPIMSNYYMQLHAIDFELTREFFPINQAIARAIETILHYFAYR
jgi:uncharacterized protein